MIFCCRRGERETELTEMFTDVAFDQTERTYVDQLYFATLTRYHEKLKDVPCLFPPVVIRDTLAECISRAGLTQFHCAESEKFAHVTFFLNGGVNRPFEGETDENVPSIRDDFEEHPALSAPQVTDKVLSKLGDYDFTVVNYANGDVIGHLTDPRAKVETARVVSAELERLIPEAVKKDMVVLVTADHGNLENMVRKDGKPDTSHSVNPVPLIVVDARMRGNEKIRDGSLSNIAPSVLQILDVPKPETMTGESLFPDLCFGGRRKVLLIILDGWGIGPENETNPIFLADTPYWDHLLTFPHSYLNASAHFVGLLGNKSGNSEAGHLNIGAGRIVPQDDMRIENAIMDGSLSRNPVLKEAIRHAEKNGGALHLIGVLSRSSSHGSVDYITAICEIAKKLPEIYLHVVTDGRVKPGNAPGQIERLVQQLEKIGKGTILTCSGRKYAMDRDMDYERVRKTYEAMVLGKGILFENKA